jgi:hypothetical protein
VVRQAPGDVLVASEGFDAVDPAPLSTLLEGVEVQVIAYLRDLPGRMVSIYNQATKHGNSTLDFDRFLERELRRPRTPLAPKVAAYAKVFGKDRVRVRSLDAHALDGGGLTSDLLAATGPGADAVARLGLESPPPRNSSPGWRTVELLRALNADSAWLDAAEAKLDAENPASVRGAVMRAALAAEESLGWHERGRYLTAEQLDRLTTRHNAELAEIEALGVDAKLVPISADDYQPRDRRPDAALLGEAELAAFYREMVKDLALQIMAKPWRNLVAETLAAGRQAEGDGDGAGG